MENEQYSSCWYSGVCKQSNATKYYHECTKQSACVKYLEMKFLMDSSGLPLAKQRPISLTPNNVDYDAFVRLADIKDNIESFVSNGNNLYIVSDVTGNGKTSWAIKLMQKYFDQVWAGNGFNPRGLFIHVPTFLTKLKDFNADKDSEFEQLKKLIPMVDMVIWDDIGSSGLSSYDLTQLTVYLDQRVLGAKTNIYTGNLFDTDLENSIGTRLYSRVWNGSERVTFKGKDRRTDGNITNLK